MVVKKKGDGKDVDEEKVLIEFGNLLAEGDEKAVKVHENYTESGKYDEFIKEAAGLIE